MEILTGLKKWENLASTPIDWTMFVHLRSKIEEIVAQKDGPAGSGYPSSFWNTGEIIVDKVVLPRQNGRQLIVGLDDAPTGVRLLAPGYPANEILLVEDMGQ